MNIRSFLKLVEIQTKVASIIPYLLGTVFAMYMFDSFKVGHACLLFFGMILFDMTTTAINNYIDYTKAIKKEGYGYEQHNAIVKDSLKPKTVLAVIFIMLIMSVGIGVVLFLNTDITVLLIGMLCFAIGILYSFGPIPISRTPFGEIFSGVTMGGLITFLAVYIHIFDTNAIGLGISNKTLNLSLDLNVIFSVILISIPAIVGIANIMLANNICDMEDDIVNKRYTLPIFIGKSRALTVFKWNYYFGFIAIIIGVVTKVLPVVSLIAIIAIKPVNDNIKKFNKNQSKKDTFVLSVQNFVLSNSIYIITILIGGIINI